MTGLDHYLGQVLDEKYRLERLLGHGGMGAVYLATHLGTERYVALKLITPQLMRNEEFVERFKREARAAGRLRHPNVVDVTDFGFARASEEPVAYLVMEYLDGCALADVLKEEKQLPLEWVVDILEQVCSAVHEAHQQGIVHRDLKPENIWLEPNRLGSYRVKVLDFGIAKLAEADLSVDHSARYGEAHAVRSGSVDGAPPTPRLQPRDLETETLLYTVDQSNQSPHSQGEFRAQSATSGTDVHQSSESKETKDTPLFAVQVRNETSKPGVDAPPASLLPPSLPAADDEVKTLRLDQATRLAPFGREATLPAATTHGTELTRVGAIMGTPLYMSPEQCAARNLDARSDIYSLGVIAYQMLAGDPPFTGDTASVLREHIEAAPSPLRERARKVPKRVAQVVMASLSKDPADRPQTAAAFANSLRAQAEGIGSLYRRAFALYSEYFPKFLRLSLIAHVPVIVITLLMIAVELTGKVSLERGTAAKVGAIVILVVLVLLQVAGYFVAGSVIAGVTAVIVTQLSAAPLRPVKLRAAFAVLKRRWRPFLNTSIRVALRIIIGFVLLLIPGLIMSIRYALFAPVVLMEGLEKKAAMRRARELAARSWRTVIIVSMLQFLIPMTVHMLLGRISISVGGDGPKASASPAHEISQQLSGLINILVVPLMSIVPALLYLKMRQLGGETLTAALEQIEEVDAERSEWQQRMRTRLTANTPRSTKHGAWQDSGDQPAK
jgi:serine/threonine protein kinase